MNRDIQSLEDLDQEGMARLVIDFFHRIVMHHAMWLSEVQHQFGRQRALGILDTTLKESLPIQMKRLADTLGFEMEGDIPSPLLRLSREDLISFKDSFAKNWLTNDGVWFQAVEFSRNMFDAKRCNDSCWAQFSPFEAWSIRRFLNLPPNPGLEGLKRALNFRIYASINKQSVMDEPNALVLQMNECRVQTTRKRKGLEDYACKSVGLIEYPAFAESIDPRIKTECVGCPPDEHPAEWYCSWRFTI
ncbi:DUF6125 family protein [Thermodesulfobacteriota bacterium]